MQAARYPCMLLPGGPSPHNVPAVPTTWASPQLREPMYPKTLSRTTILNNPEYASLAPTGMASQLTGVQLQCSAALQRR